MREGEALFLLGVIILFIALFLAFMDVLRSSISGLMLDLVIGLFGVACLLTWSAIQKLEERLAGNKEAVA